MLVFRVVYVRERFLWKRGSRERTRIAHVLWDHVVQIWWFLPRTVATMVSQISFLFRQVSDLFNGTILPFSFASQCFAMKRGNFGQTSQSCSSKVCWSAVRRRPRPPRPPRQEHSSETPKKKSRPVRARINFISQSTATIFKFRSKDDLFQQSPGLFGEAEQ